MEKILSTLGKANQQWSMQDQDNYSFKLHFVIFVFVFLKL